MPHDKRRVKISEEIGWFPAKGPFAVSGVSIKGGIEYDPEEDKLKCHECGEWFSDLAAHAFARHQLKSDEYKLRHGLNLSSALCCERLRQCRIKGQRKSAESFNANRKKDGKHIRRKPRQHGNASIERQNKLGLCADQLLEKLTACANSVGHTPTHVELKEYKLSRRALETRFGSVREALRIAGFMPRPQGRNVLTYNRESLLAMVYKFKQLQGRWPTYSDCRRGLLPNRKTFYDHFGGWPKMLAIAKEGKNDAT